MAKMTTDILVCCTRESWDKKLARK